MLLLLRVLPPDERRTDACMIRLCRLNNTSIPWIFLLRSVLRLHAILHSRSTVFVLFCVSLVDFVVNGDILSISLALQSDEVDICAAYDV